MSYTLPPLPIHKRRMSDKEIIIKQNEEIKKLRSRIECLEAIVKVRNINVPCRKCGKMGHTSRDCNFLPIKW